MTSQVAQRGRDRAGLSRMRFAVMSMLVLVLVALAGSLLDARPAWAHATVSRSEPADQARLDTAPPAVTIWFSEAVDPDAGGMTVINQGGEEVQTDVHQPSPTSLMAMLRPGLPNGTYVATYRIVSEDGHPITGSIVFGAGEPVLADVSALTTEPDASQDALSKVAQVVTYLGALGAAGLVFFLAFLAPAVTPTERRRLSRLVHGGAVAAVVGMAVVIATQTAQATGRGLGAVTDLEDVRAALGQGLGMQGAGLVVGLALLLVALRVPAGAAAGGLAAVGGLVTSLSFVLWGHAIEGATAWLSIPADAVHLVVAAVWFGGLVGLGILLQARPGGVRAAIAGAVHATSSAGTGTVATAAATTTADEDGTTTARALASSGGTTAVLDAPPEPGSGNGDGPTDSTVTEPADPAVTPDPGANERPAAEGADATGLAATVTTVRRFSAAAFVSLITLTVAGIVLGLVEMGGIGNLLSGTYGRLLLAKIAVVAVVAAAAGYNRYRLLPDVFAGRTPANGRDGWATLRRTVLFEAAAIVVVLGITGVLTNTTPNPTAAAPGPSAPLKQSQPLDDVGTATLEITPNRPGVNTIMVTVARPDGRPLEVEGVEVELTLKERGVGPITRTLMAHGGGHYMTDGSSDLSMPGTWAVDVLVRIDEFDEERLTFQDAVS
jgi:copper transport protein